jgi:hypothetical protein
MDRIDDADSVNGQLPRYMDTIMKKRKYRTKYADLTPEQRMEEYNKKRIEWREKHMDKVKSYGHVYCDVCEKQLSNAYKHNTTKKHIANMEIHKSLSVEK